MTWFGDITVRQAARHAVTYAGTVATILVFMLGWARPQAEDFVRDTIAQEKFVTQEELAKQSKALEDLSSTVQKQSDAIQEQNSQMGIVQNDIGTIKQLQKDTLRAILKLPNE